MDAADPTVSQLITLVRAGDNHAADLLWDQFFPRLVQLANRQLGSQQRTDADEQDIVVSAFASFFKAAARNRFPNLNGQEDLWVLLSTLTRRKVVNLIRRRSRRKRNPQVFSTEPAPGPAAAFEPELVAAENITPDMALILQEECLRLLSQLGDPLLQKIALLRQDGFTHKEIAEQLDLSTATIERRVKLIRKIWSEENEE